MKPRFNRIAYKVGSTKNAYGDYIAGAETEHPCLFRNITDLVVDMNDVIHSDAMAWFEPDSGIIKGDIVKIDGIHYMVERMLPAQGLRPDVQFLKTELRVYGDIS